LILYILGCYIKPLGDDKQKVVRIAVYDFETSQDTIIKEGVTGIYSNKNTQILNLFRAQGGICFSPMDLH
jgi:hypothetical protein